MDIDFNKTIFEKMLKLGKITKQDSILVVGGLYIERDYFVSLGFKNVTISNICDVDPETVAPFKYIKENMNQLTLPDNSFDFVYVSASLHHCSSPVRALLEMYRVAKRGIVVVEARDSLTMKLGQKIKMIPTYEFEAVSGNIFLSGGVDDTEIPNYIYRWTEREFKKLVSSFNPVGTHKFFFFYKFAPSFSQVKVMGHKLKYYLLKSIATMMKPLVFLLKKQGNSFGAVILKPHIPEDIFPWLKLESDKVVFNREFKG